MKLVKIIPPEYDGKGVAISQGVKVISDEGEIQGITRIQINMGADEIITAEIDLYVVFDEFEGVEGRVGMTHPKTGKWAEVKAIEFANGDRVEL